MAIDNVERRLRGYREKLNINQKKESGGVMKKSAPAAKRKAAWRGQRQLCVTSINKSEEGIGIRGYTAPRLFLCCAEAA